MKDRCLCKNNPSYKNYGNRGITICPEWLIFENFHNDMGDKPENKSLERINNNKGYYKENCRWATPKEQANNRRNNRNLTYNGKTQTMIQWAEELKVSYRTFKARKENKWSDERTIKTPFRTYRTTKYEI